MTRSTWCQVSAASILHRRHGFAGQIRLSAHTPRPESTPPTAVGDKRFHDPEFREPKGVDASSDTVHTWVRAARPFSNPEPTGVGHHLAFRVTEADFSEVVKRLAVSRIAFGNDPEEPNNGETRDQLGGRGRVYFVSPDGHLFEVTID